MKFHLFILPFLLFACAGTEQENNAEQEETNLDKNDEPTFTGYLSKIPDEKLPFEIDCSTPFFKFDISYKVYEKYIPEGGSTYSKLITEAGHNLVVYTFAGDIINPILYSYDSNGQVIDSLWLYNGSCNGDPWLESSCHTIVREDLTIEMHDTIQHYFFNDTIRRLDSTSLETELYKVNEEGKFAFVSKNTVLLGVEN
ncbi:hypothetical protein K6119_08000 [Paracrocinitomix mangrovi]|uniref:hypothetical protein n=1 Tax=Paracrocinitomix mangrovi TaxID=2862509 RepID=UPI001EDC4F97|nr:hypothetical protein [Paracrocinitomix mangrovi]UKN03454.1 hypothetical protein K6119_08000 [Paracrocinitomix mangrovi]